MIMSRGELMIQRTFVCNMYTFEFQWIWYKCNSKHNNNSHGNSNNNGNPLSLYNFIEILDGLSRSSYWLSQWLIIQYRVSYYYYYRRLVHINLAFFDGKETENFHFFSHKYTIKANWKEM